MFCTRSTPASDVIANSTIIIFLLLSFVHGCMAATGSKALITFVTGNAKKLEEVKLFLAKSAPGGDSAALPFTLTNQKIDLPELQ